MVETFTITEESRMNGLSILDTHQHLWDLSRITLDWIKDIPELDRSFLLDDYTAQTRCPQGSQPPYSVDRTLYMEVDVPDDQIDVETDWVLESCRDESSPMVGLIASARPGSASFDRSLKKANENPEIRGFRRVLHTDATGPGYCLQPDFQRDIHRLGDLGLTFDLCLRREELVDAGKLADACRNTRLIVDHCGNADVRMTDAEFRSWAETMKDIARRDNVFCKVSGFVWTIQDPAWSYESTIRPILQVVYDAFGSERMLFGGDWPVCTLSCLTFPEWIGSLYRFANDVSADFPVKLFSQNGESVYDLGH